MVQQTMIPDAHTLPLPIQWHEGMLLAPQHFQQLSHRSEQLLHWRSMLADPFQWGVRRFAYDHALLLSGRFRVLELEALMPDGLVVALAKNGIEELEVDLALYEQELQEGAVTVHLAIAAQRNGAALAVGDHARYDSVMSPPIADDNTGVDGIEIPYLRPRIILLVSDAPPSRYVSVPLARIEKKNGLFTLTDFIPPTLCIELDSPVGEICREIATMLREKSVYLSEEIRANHYDMGSPAMLEKRAQIRSMVEGLPFLEGILFTGKSHPYPLYLALCIVSGHVATLGDAYVPPVFPAYDHNDLRKTFKALRDFIMTSVEQGIWEEYIAVTFELKNDLFLRRIEPAWLDEPLLIGVRGAARVSQREIAAWMESALIGSASVMQSLRERRILGADRRRREDGYQRIATRGAMLYEIEVEPEFVRPSEDLLIQSIGESGGIVQEIVLFVRNKRL
jgi:type VI secretion system protein ImpJ